MKKIITLSILFFASTSVAQMYTTAGKETVFKIKQGTVLLYLENGDEAPDKIHFTFSGKDRLFATAWGTDVNQDFLGHMFQPGDLVSPSTYIDRGNAPLMGSVSLSETLLYEWIVFHGTGVTITGDYVALPQEQGRSSFSLTVPVKLDGEIKGCPIDIKTDWEHPGQCLEPYVPFVLAVHKEGRAIMDFYWDPNGFYTVVRATYIINPVKD